jgi:hypothetical protein
VLLPERLFDAAAAPQMRAYSMLGFQAYSHRYYVAYVISFMM